MSNIIEMNKMLFQALEDIKNDKLDIKKAQAMVNVSNAISTNAKLMLQVARLSNNPKIGELMLGESTIKDVAPKTVYELKLEFAKKEGFANIAEAIEKLGKSEFELQFRDEQEGMEF